jgi:hypothetical protein
MRALPSLTVDVPRGFASKKRHQENQLLTFFVFKMAPLRTLAALALSVGVVSGFAPANNFATKQATRYDVFGLL